MSVTVEKLEKNMAKLTIEVPAEEIAAAEQRAYQKQKSKIAVPGFRKGKAPRSIIEKLYGENVWMEDAVNDVLPEAYEKACEESGLTITSRPVLDYTQCEHGKSLIVVATVAVKPEVTLGDYKGLEAPKKEITVTEEEITAEIAKEQEKNATEEEVDNRPVAEGDIVGLDYAGTVDGVAFDGGTAQGQTLVIGSHSFIEGFEEQMIGMNIGEEKDLNVTFPEKYHAENLAGKPAVFHVKVNSIAVKTLPELNDEFASEVSEFETLDEYKNSVKEKLMKQKEESALREKEDALLKAAVANASMEIPDAMIESTAENMVQEFGQRLQMQGLKLEQYMQYIGMTPQQMIEQNKAAAKTQIEGRLVLEAIAKAEGVEITDADLDAKYEEMSKQYQMDVEKIKSFMDDASVKTMKEDMAAQKALEILVAASK